jgi:3-methyladenine DNA glycosylase AlkD
VEEEMKLSEIQKQIRKLGDRAIAEHSQRFFKTGKGEYGEGDKFLGIRVPVLRKQAKHYKELPFEVVSKLLFSEYHEERLLCLLILVLQFSNGGASDQQAIYRFYLKHTYLVNNWDLVDTSAEHIVGAYLFTRSRKPLYKLAHSKLLWERRIAIMSTYHYIKRNEFDDTLKIAKILYQDPEDLIQKAVGWMLREVGKRQLDLEEEFLKQHYQNMPRTMLRYAIEKFPQENRKAYLKGTI